MTLSLSSLTILITLLFLLSGLLFTVLIDPYIQRKHRFVMIVIVVLCFTLIAQNIIEDRLSYGTGQHLLRTIFSVYGYAVRPLFLVLFLCIVQEKKVHPFWWALIAANAALYCTSLFSLKICFIIDENNRWRPGPLSHTALYISAALMICLLIRSIREFREHKRNEKWIPLLIVVMIALSVYLDYDVGKEEQPISFLTAAIVVGSVFYYIWLHLQFVREHENDLIASQRIEIMMTQIQPHFLFNALNTIRALYAKDPPLAERTLENFSTYLRQNLDSLSRSELIPVSKELVHVKLYTEIEVLRFPDIKVEYRIGDEDFGIPALTIQPLVENAIKHGVRGIKNGLVTISTVREDCFHRVTIKDNGAGFDTEQQLSPEREHIGIKNVKDRIERMCGGTMTIKSGIGHGTSVTLLIPDASAKESTVKR